MWARVSAAIRRGRSHGGLRRGRYHGGLSRDIATCSMSVLLARLPQTDMRQTAGGDACGGGGGGSEGDQRYVCQRRCAVRGSG